MSGQFSPESGASSPKTAASSPAWTPERIKQMRERFGMTQGEAGRWVGIGKSMWCHWEHGRHRPSKPFLILLDLFEQGRLDAPKPDATIPV